MHGVTFDNGWRKPNCDYIPLFGVQQGVVHTQPELNQRQNEEKCDLQPTNEGTSLGNYKRNHCACLQLLIDPQTVNPRGPTHIFNDGGVRQRFIFYTPKNTNFRICLPKKIPTFVNIPKKIPQCFCISKFYYLSSGKLKHANFNFGFGQKQHYNLRLCYF